MAETVIALVISALLSYATAEIQKGRAERARSALDKQIESNKATLIKSVTRSTAEPLKLIYGVHRVGGNDVYVSTSEGDATVLWIIQTIGEGEIDSIYQVDSVDQIFIDKKIYTEINDKDLTKTLVAWDFYSGTNTQNLSDGSLYAEFIAGNPDATDNYRNTSFILWRFQYNELFRGNPQRELVIKGKVLYDFRTATSTWSNNPVLALYDFITNSRYGPNIPAEDIDLASWEEVADYCETKDFTLNYVANLYEVNWIEVIDSILKVFRGGFTEYDGKLFLRFQDTNEETSIMSITDEHIVQDQNGKSSITVNKPGLFEYPKLMRITYIDAEKDWSEDSFLIGEENNSINDLRLDGITNATHAGIIGTYELERGQLNRTISGTFRDECIKLDPYDIITFTSTALFIDEQEMRVVSSNLSPNNNVNLVLEYEADTLYNDIYDAGDDTLYKSSQPDRRVPSTISESTIEEETYYFRKRTQSRLNIDFTVPEYDIWFDHVEVWVSISDDIEANYRHWGDEVSNFSIDPVEEDQVYWIVLKTVNKWGVKQTHNAATKLFKSIIGASLTRPPSPEPLLALPSDGAVALRSTDLNSPDIYTYEIRLGDQWDGGIYLASNESPNFFLKPIKPGNYTFWLNTLGTNGLYGATPTSTNVNVPLPKGWDLAFTVNDYYNSVSSSKMIISGSTTFNNTEHFTYNAQDWIKCSHTSDGTSVTLVGYYESKVFDVGEENVDTFMMFIDTDYVVLGGGTTWVELYGDGTDVTETWEYQGDEVPWTQVFQLEQAPNIEMSIFYKEYSGDPWSELSSAQILAGVVKGRYFKVRINITDPADAINLYVKHYTLKLYV